jgi:K+-sensing histidine kinase KdpD
MLAEQEVEQLAAAARPPCILITPRHSGQQYQAQHTAHAVHCSDDDMHMDVTQVTDAHNRQACSGTDTLAKALRSHAQHMAVRVVCSWRASSVCWLSRGY